MAVVTQRPVDLAGALCAGGPHPEHADALMLFGQFVGEWDFDWAGYGDREQTLTDAGEWIFGWVLEGRAVQDVWIIPPRDRRGEAGVPAGEYGTTLRFYDPRLDAWLVTWNGPSNRARRTFSHVHRATKSCRRGRPRRVTRCVGSSPRSSSGRSTGRASS